VTGYYKGECARYGWQPGPQQIIYRASILIAETDEKAQQALAQYPREAVFRLKDRVAATLLEVDQRNVAGEGRRSANVNRALPINLCGGPDEIVAQLQEARERIGCGVVDLSFQTPGSERPDQLMEAGERPTLASAGTPAIGAEQPRFRADQRGTAPVLQHFPSNWDVLHGTIRPLSVIRGYALLGCMGCVADASTTSFFVPARRWARSAAKAPSEALCAEDLARPRAAASGASAWGWRQTRRYVVMVRRNLLAYGS
jgi:hypothetical protein